MRAFRSPNPCFLAVAFPPLSAPRLPEPRALAALEDTHQSACREVSRAGSWEVCAMGMWQGALGLGLVPQRLPGLWCSLGWGTHTIPGPWQLAVRGPHKACSNVTISWEPSVIPSAIQHVQTPAAF